MDRINKERVKRARAAYPVATKRLSDTRVLRCIDRIAANHRIVNETVNALIEPGAEMSIKELTIKAEKLTAEIKRATAEREKFALALLSRDRIRAMHKAGK